MPKKLTHAIDQGYNELDQNKIDDALDQRAGMQLEQDNVEQQVQDIQNAQPEAAAPAA